MKKRVGLFGLVLLSFCVVQPSFTQVQLPSINLNKHGIDPNILGGSFSLLNDKNNISDQISTNPKLKEALEKSMAASGTPSTSAQTSSTTTSTADLENEYKRIVLQFISNYYPAIISKGKTTYLVEGMQSLVSIDNGDMIEFHLAPGNGTKQHEIEDLLAKIQISGLADIVDSMSFTILNYNDLDINKVGIEVTDKQSKYGILPSTGYDFPFSPFNRNLIDEDLVDDVSVLKIQVSYSILKNPISYYAIYRRSFESSYVGMNAYYLTDISRVAGVFTNISESFRNSNVTAALWFFKNQWNSYKNDKKSSLAIYYPLIYPVLADTELSIKTGLGLGVGVNINEKLNFGIGFDAFNFDVGNEKYGVNFLLGAELASLFK